MNVQGLVDMLVNVDRVENVSVEASTRHFVIRRGHLIVPVAKCRGDVTLLDLLLLRSGVMFRVFDTWSLGYFRLARLTLDCNIGQVAHLINLTTNIYTRRFSYTVLLLSVKCVLA